MITFPHFKIGSSQVTYQINIFRCCQVFIAHLKLGKYTPDIITCSRHQNLQKIRIRILQIFCYDFFCLIKSRANCSGITQPFLNPNLIFFSNVPQIVCRRIIKKNQNKDLENWRFRCHEQVIGGENKVSLCVREIS